MSRSAMVSGTHSTRVVIIDDHELLRNGMRLLIGGEPTLEVCGEAVDEAEGIRVIRKLQPDIAVVDISLANGNGLELIKWLKRHYPDVKAIVTTMHDEKIYGERALRAGAHGYVSKQAPARTIISAIECVLRGELFFSRALTNRLMQRLGSAGDVTESPIETLSDRELEVFRHIGHGMTPQAIANRMNLSPSTVDTYRERLKVKLELQTGAEVTRAATLWVLENG